MQQQGEFQQTGAALGINTYRGHFWESKRAPKSKGCEESARRCRRRWLGCRTRRVWQSISRLRGSQSGRRGRRAIHVFRVVWPQQRVLHSVTERNGRITPPHGKRPRAEPIRLYHDYRGRQSCTLVGCEEVLSLIDGRQCRRSNHKRFEPEWLERKR